MNWINKFSGKELSNVLHLIETENLMWFAKRLSGNDTNLTGGHQVGIYIPRNVIQALSPEINNTDHLNPDKFIDQTLFINNDYIAPEKLRIIYYNNQFTRPNGTRNEFRITRWGGKNCPVCKGNGWCPKVVFYATIDKGMVKVELKEFCSVCNGSGKLLVSQYR